MFNKINSKMVEVNLNQGLNIMSRRGAMLSYTGEVYFQPSTGGGGAGGFIGRVLKGEQQPMMMCQGNGSVMFGLNGLEVNIVDLNNEQLFVEASKVLAFPSSLQASTVFLGRGGGGFQSVVAGNLTGQGLFTTCLQGSGQVAILSHGPVFDIIVGSNNVVVDPQAYVAHKGNIKPEIKLNASWRDAVGKGSGEATQLLMQGQGTVFVQASERAF